MTNKEQIEFNSPKEALEKYIQGIITDNEAIDVIRAFPTGIQIPKDYFKYPSIVEQLEIDTQDTPTNKSNAFSFKGVEFKDRIYVNIETAHFPIKGYTTTSMLADFNKVKSLFIEPIKLLSLWQFIPAIVITAFSIKSVEKILESFNRLTDRLIRSYILKREHSTDFTQEFEYLVCSFLKKIGISEFNSKRFSEAISTVIENDSAYRLRLEELFTASYKTAWINPRKEISRLIDIFCQRDINDAVKSKIKALAMILNIGLIINPKINRALKDSFMELDFKKLQLDDIDTYWILIREDYNAFGLSHEERIELLKKKGWKTPKTIPFLRKRDLLLNYGYTQDNYSFASDTAIITDEEVDNMEFEELNRWAKKNK